MSRHAALQTLLLEHRFPAHWAQVLQWDPDALATILPRQHCPDLFGYDPADGVILFNPAIAGGLARHGQTWVALRDTVEHVRAATLLNDLAGLDRPFLADMRDHRTGPALDLPAGCTAPVFQFNRLPGTVGCILWPLSDHFQSIGSPTYFGTPFRDEIPFADKQDRVFWRGGPTGHDSDGIRAIRSLRDHAAGHLDRATCAARLKTVPRFALLDRFQHLPDYDLAIVDSPALPSAAPFGYRTCPAMERREMVRSRYQLAVGGNDYASNLPWLLGTHCLVFLQQMDWQLCYTGALQPWRHYVPIAADFADLPDKLDWARANPASCRAIIAQANRLAQDLADPDLEAALRRAVLDRYRAAISG